MFTWKLFGEIFNVEQYLGGKNWASSHAQLPTAFLLDDKTGMARIFFAARDNNNRSRVAFFDYNLENYSVSNVSDSPVLDMGPTGHFDQHGVYPASIVKKGSDYYLYYIGWTSAEPKPLFYAAIGCAISKDLKTFEKVSRGPVMDRSHYDPCLVTSPYVFHEGGEYLMGYVSGDEWFEKDGLLASKYNIKLAKSSDLLNWHREGKVLIDYSNNETNIARPSILKIKEKYYMWYSFVGDNKKYRMGYAVSKDFINWTRKDHEIDKFPQYNHNVQMSCYPSVISYKNNLYMFFNGNNYGKEGVLLAKCEILEEA